MAPSTHSRTIQWVLLCVLFLGVVGMHHVNVSTDMPLPHGHMSTSAHGAPPSEDPVPQPAHEMPHLCVAVLNAVVSLFLLVWLLLLRTERPIAGRVQASVAWPRAPDRPPPRGGRDLLSSLCVLRL